MAPIISVIIIFRNILRWKKSMVRATCNGCSFSIFNLLVHLDYKKKSVTYMKETGA
ncbi:hypothetical protein [Terribacillus aidingensis]|uniref:hypothetical protein n=1 Tax=Terribacillus aidingensis TaxID=586416 RepID=UPI003CCBCE68